MASKWPPVKNSGFTFRVVLFAQSDDQIKTTPTIAAGDFKVSTDGAALANLGTLPSESPASSGQVLITLSAGEMNGDEVLVKAVDASGDEWHSQAWTIHTVGQTFDTVDGNIDSILTDTAEIGAAGAGLTAVPYNSAWDAEIQSECTDALNAYDPPTKAELDTAVANVSVDEIQATALADLFNTDSGTTYAAAVSGSVVSEIADNAGGSALTAEDIADAVWEEAIGDHEATEGSTAEKLSETYNDTYALADVAIPDSVPADGSRPTVRQALYMITQFLMERSISGTTVTVKKVDGSTSLLTLTLNDDTTPTSVTRAT